MGKKSAKPLEERDMLQDYLKRLKCTISSPQPPTINKKKYPNSVAYIKYCRFLTLAVKVFASYAVEGFRFWSGRTRTRYVSCGSGETWWGECQEWRASLMMKKYGINLEDGKVCDVETRG